MKKNAKKDVKKAECGGKCKCADRDNPTAAQALKTELAAEIAGAIAVPENQAEEMGKKAAVALAAKQATAEPKLGDTVMCIGLECGKRSELAERTLVVRDSDAIQPLCPRCAEAACRAQLSLMPYGIWQERKDRFSAKVEELRGLDVQATGGNRKAIHEALLDLTEEELDKAIVVSTKPARKEDVRGMVILNKMALAAFFKTHNRHNFCWEEAKGLLNYFEQEERQMKKQEEYFRRLAEQRQQKFAAKGARRQQADASRISQFVQMASGGNGNGSKPAAGNGNEDRAPTLREFGITIPAGVQIEAAGLKSSPFAGLKPDAPQN